MVEPEERRDLSVNWGVTAIEFGACTYCGSGTWSRWAWLTDRILMWSLVLSAKLGKTGMRGMRVDFAEFTGKRGG